jgi:hypothetical protein
MTRQETMTVEQFRAEFGRGGKRQPGYRTFKHLDGMNKLEAAYSAELDLLLRAGEIRGWKFEAVKLRLADKTFYTPDFLVVLKDGSLEFHETKGHMKDDAAVKLKVAAELYPMFRFRLFFRAKSQWIDKSESYGL